MQVVHNVSVLAHVIANYFGRMAIAVLSKKGGLRASSHFCSSSSVPPLVSAKLRAISLTAWLTWRALSLSFLSLNYISLH